MAGRPGTGAALRSSAKTRGTQRGPPQRRSKANERTTCAQIEPRRPAGDPVEVRRAVEHDEHVLGDVAAGPAPERVSCDDRLPEVRAGDHAPAEERPHDEDAVPDEPQP